MEKKLKLVGDRILVDVESESSDFAYGMVLLVGEGSSSSYMFTQKPKIKVGDRIYFTTTTAVDFDVVGLTSPGQHLLMIYETNVLAIVQEEG